MTKTKVPPQPLNWTQVARSLACMTDDDKKTARAARPAVKYGPTAAEVAKNVRRVREVRGHTIYSLAGELARAGRPITPSGIAKIEKQQRQVTVDDLVALAVALDVSPGSLLLPLTDASDDRVKVTGAGEVAADTAWSWVSNERPLKPGKRDPGTERLEYQLYGLPPGRRSSAAPAWGRDVVEAGSTAYALHPAPKSGARSVAELARRRREFELWVSRADESEQDALLRVFMEHDPEAFEPHVTEWMVQRGLLPIEGGSDGPSVD